MFSNIHTASPPLGKRSLGFSFFTGLIAAISLMMVLSASAEAAAPPANSSISNQASASYTDGSGAVKSALSNNVVTLVSQVAALSLTTDNTKTIAAGTTAYAPHILTNLGNGSDTFSFTLADNNAPGTFSSLQLFLDANGDGVPDTPNTPLCTGVAACSAFVTPSVPAGGTFKFIVALQVPIGASAGTFDTATITAKSVLTPAETAANTDTVIITTGAAFQVTKDISLASGLSSLAGCGPTYTGTNCVKTTYTLTYRNNGAAGNLYLKDIIGTGATSGMEYIPGSARWSNSGSTALTDAVDVGIDPAGIDFQALSGTIEAVITVGANVSGKLTFEVGIQSTAAIGVSTTTNIGQYDVATGTTVATSGVTTPSNQTNPSSYTVGQVYSVVANDWSNNATDGDNVTKDEGTNPRDVSLVASAAPGTTVTFDNYIWNTGTGVDTFNIALSASNFPANTVLQLYKFDGSTSLADSNSDGIVDTGPLNPGTSYKVVVKAIIQADACTPSCPVGPFTVTKTASSIGDSAKTNVVFDQLTALSSPTVDLTNSLAGTASDTGFNNNATATTTNTIAAGNTTSFDLYVKNGGIAPDNYNLEYSISNFIAGTKPAGWTIVFRSTSDNTVNGSCGPSSGNVITNTGNVPANNGQVKVCAVITTPANATAGTNDIYFKVISGATLAYDIKHDAVTINNNAIMTLTPPGSGQIFPGGSIVYKHDLTNSGNLSCGGDFTFSMSGVKTGWSVAVYEDTNNNGTIETTVGGDKLLVSHNGSTLLQAADLTGPLPIGSVRKLLVKVTSPAGAASGDTDNIVISVVDNGASACTAQPTNDTTLIITGQLRLDKTQANDALCDGIADAPGFVDTGLTAKPGECLVYKVVAVNEGTTSVTAVSINDTTPNFTTYYDGTAHDKALTCSTGTATAPSVGSTGALNCGPIAVMAPGATETMQFVVKVNN